MWRGGVPAQLMCSLGVCVGGESRKKTARREDSRERPLSASEDSTVTEGGAPCKGRTSVPVYVQQCPQHLLAVLLNPREEDTKEPLRLIHLQRPRAIHVELVEEASQAGL
jgi:hypothetical protein